MKEKKNPIGLIFYFSSYVLFILSLVFLFSHLSRGIVDLNIFYNSDSLSHPIIFKDLFEDGFNYSGWMFSDSPSFFPDFLMYSFLRLALGNFRLALLVNSILIFLFIFIFSDLLIAKLLNPSYIIRGLLVFTGTLLTVLMSLGREFLFTVLFLSPDFHVGTLMITTFCLYLIFSYLKLRDRRVLFLLFSVMFLVSVYDRLWLIHFVIPLALMCVLGSLLMKSLRDRFVVLLGLLFASLLAGNLLYKIITPFPTSPSIVLKFSVFSNLLRDLLQLLSAKFLSINVGSIDYQFPNDTFPFMLILLAVSVISPVFVHFVFLRNADRDEELKLAGLYLIYFVFLIAADLFGTVLSGQYVSLTHSRYFTPVFLHSLIAFILLVGVVLRRVSDRTLLFPSLCILLFQLVLVKLVSTDVVGSYNSLMSYKPDVVKCLDSLSASYRLDYGLSDYWNANLTTMFSNKNLRVYQVHTYYPSPNPYHWNNNMDWYLGDPSSDYPTPKYNFVFTKRLSKESLLLGFGEPSEVIECEDQEIWLYESDKEAYIKNVLAPRIIFRTLRRPEDLLFINGGLLNSILLDPFEKLRVSSTTTDTGGNLVTSVDTGAGNITLGPYFYIENGDYYFSLNYASNALLNEEIGLLTISKSSKPNFVKISLRGSRGEERVLKGAFSVSDAKRDPSRLYRTEDIQFKIWSSSSRPLVIRNLLIKRIR